jgi:hypothetical protein
MLVTPQYQPRLSSITNIFSKPISQSDCSIQIKLDYFGTPYAFHKPLRSLLSVTCLKPGYIVLPVQKFQILSYKLELGKSLTGLQPLPGYASITCSNISNVPYNLISPHMTLWVR